MSGWDQGTCLPPSSRGKSKRRVVEMMVAEPAMSMRESLSFVGWSESVEDSGMFAGMMNQARAEAMAIMGTWIRNELGQP